MDTIARVMELADERNLSLFKLSQLCDVSYSTLKNAEMRGSQLGVPTIEPNTFSSLRHYGTSRSDGSMPYWSWQIPPVRLPDGPVGE